MASIYTTLTADQKEAIMAARNDQSRQMDGMAKWEVVFVGGSHCTMLTDQCRDRESALLGAIERFGAKVKDVR